MMRICQHEQEGLKIFDGFSIYPKRNYSNSELDIEEKKYIMKYSPKYNIVHNKLNKEDKSNPNECEHVFRKYSKSKPCNYCVKCKKKIANPYYKDWDKKEYKRISKYNKDEEYNDRYLKAK